MKKTIIGGLLAAGIAFTTVGSAAANTTLYEQDFSSGTGDWGENGATVEHTGDEMSVSGVPGNYGAFSYWGGESQDETLRSSFPGDGYISELDVYLDPEFKANEYFGQPAFDLSSAISATYDNDSTPGVDHRRDFIFHVGQVTDGRLLVNASNNTDFTLNEYKLTNGTPFEVATEGWYTLQHVFRNDNGVLAVDMNVVFNDAVVWSTTRTNPADTIDLVGGPRYNWLTFVEGGFRFDNQSLELVTPTPASKDDCKQGGFETFGFDNQGQCVASVMASENSVH